MLPVGGKFFLSTMMEFEITTSQIGIGSSDRKVKKESLNEAASST